MANLFWLHRIRSRRARWTSAWIGVVLITAGVLFLTIRWGDRASYDAASKPSSFATEPN
jgi:hypothetical protein